MKVIASRSTIFILAYSALIFASCAHTDTPIIGNKPEVPRAVSFKGTAADIIEGSLNLTGRLTKPERNGPFPAIVLLHGCGGIQSRRDHRWADRLSGWGYVTLQVDSFRPRGLSSVCTYSGTDVLDIVQKRVGDAYDAKRYLVGLPFVDRNRIAVMGWSHGGRTTLQALYQKKKTHFGPQLPFILRAGRH